MSWIKLTKTAFSIFKVLSINLVVVALLLLSITSLLAYFSRFSDAPKARYLTKGSYDTCMSGDHGNVSLEQAKILNKSTNPLDEYCKSKASFSEEWIQSRTYWDYHYYSQTQLDTPSIKFESTDLFNARKTPCSRDVADISITNVWLFGGSTMQNMETSDESTIGNILCLRMNEVSPTSVLNLGVGSFTAEMEMHKFLNLLKFTISHSAVARPDIAIFYDGYNDSQRLIWGKWSGLPSSISDKFATVYSSLPSVWLHSTLQLAENYFLELSDGKSNLTSEVISALKSRIDISGRSNYLLAKRVEFEEEIDGMLVASRAYLEDQASLSGICLKNKIKCYVILQPVLPLRNSLVGDVETRNYQNWGSTTKQGSIIRRFYKEVSRELIRLESPYYKVLSLADLPNDIVMAAVPFFYDFGHTGFYASEIIGNAIARDLMLEDRFFLHSR